MPKSRPPYPAEFRQRMVRSPEELAEKASAGERAGGAVLLSG